MFAALSYTKEAEPIIPWRVGRDFDCCELFSVATGGASPEEQNMGYTMVNHKDMLRDQPRVRCLPASRLPLPASGACLRTPPTTHRC